jgi:hypothetical protein
MMFSPCFSPLTSLGRSRREGCVMFKHSPFEKLNVIFVNTIIYTAGWEYTRIDILQWETRTMAAECQVTKILIGPRNKNARKKDSAVKIILSPFQITSSAF